MCVCLYCLYYLLFVSSNNNKFCALVVASCVSVSECVCVYVCVRVCWQRAREQRFVRCSLFAVVDAQWYIQRKLFAINFALEIC